MWGYINGGVIEEELHYKIFSVLMCCELAEGGGRGGGECNTIKNADVRGRLLMPFLCPLANFFSYGVADAED